MNQIHRMVGGPLALFSLVVATAAYAQSPATAVVTYGLPQTTNSIPTLSQWALIALATVMLVIAVRQIRVKSKIISISLSLLAGTLVLGAAFSDKIINSANAIPSYSFINPGNGTLTISIYDNNNNLIQNNAGVPVQIISVAPAECYSISPGSTCIAGAVIPASANCTLQIISSCASDARLKKEIVYLTTLENGIKIYSFKYLWSDEIHVGVMAQDLLESNAYKNAVVLHADGYYRVNYRTLGLQMISLSEWNKSSTNIFAHTDREHFFALHMSE